MTNRFQKWALATTIATYILIFIGGLVRAADAGLGCIDWPTCFGKPYPPFSRAELLQRNIPADFNVDNFSVNLAWLEYFNRLSGAVIGVLLIVTLYYAIKAHRHNKRILIPTVAAFVTVLVNGWLGGQVIESKLEPLVISVHLSLALVQVSLLLYATVSAFYPQGGLPKGILPAERKILSRVALVVLVLALIQAAFGADLRGQLETVEEANPQVERDDWIDEVGLVDQVHRSFAWVVLLGVLWMIYYTHQKTDLHPWLSYGTQLAGALVITQIIAGIILAYLGLPPPLQVIHVIVGSWLIGSVTLIYLLATRLPNASSSRQPPLSTLQTATD